MREVVSGMFVALTLKVGGSALAFAFNVAIARLLGAEGTGIYFLALAVTTIGSVVGRVGLDNTLLRYVAANATHDDWGKVLGVYAIGIRISVMVSGIVTLIIFSTATWTATTLFHKPELAEPLRWMSFSVLPSSLLNLQAESLKGLKRLREAMFIQGIVVPLVALALILPLTQSAGVLGASISYVIGAVIAAILGAWAWRYAVKDYDKAAPIFPIADVWASCRPLFVVSIMNNGIRSWAPLFLLGIWASSHDAGIFGAALRLLNLTTFVLFTLNNVLAPKFTELYVKGDMQALARTARHSTLLMAILASPIFIVLIFASHWVMSFLYGKDFESGATILAIMAMGQIINVFTGPVGTVLIVSGNEQFTQNITIFGSASLLILCVILIPIWGGFGAALAMALSATGLSLASARYVHKNLKIAAVPFISW